MQLYYYHSGSDLSKSFPALKRSKVIHTNGNNLIYTSCEIFKNKKKINWNKYKILKVLNK